jgi:hypothetical protein
MQNVLIDDWSEQSLSDLAVRLERVLRHVMVMMRR